MPAFVIPQLAFREGAQILRFDAVSALVTEGGEEGRRIVLEHKGKEPNESLRKLIELTRRRIQFSRFTVG